MNEVNQHIFEAKDNVLTYGNLMFFVVESNSSFKIDHLLGYDAILLDARDEDFTRAMIRNIRGHYNPEFYLKPLFLLNAKETKDPLINNLNDGIIYSFDQVKDIAENVKQIFLKTTQLDYQNPGSFEGQTFKKVLNYMFTRDTKTITPFPSVHSVIGYVFPELSVSFNINEEWQVLDVLEWAEKEGLVWPDFQDRIYLCNNCKGGLLLYREVCPHCNSSNSKSEDLVHHFPCAYIGPISDFKNPIDNTLSCPKCNKALRHIGVDYDKPSIINHCNNCNNNFQDFFVKAKCLSCTQDNEVQYLISKTINTYKLTKKGRSVAVSGLVAVSQEIGNVFGTVPFESFKVMLHYQVERMKNNPALDGNLAVIYFENIYQLYSKIGKKAQRSLIHDLVSLMRENIRPSDFITLENASTFYICLNDVDKITAQSSLKSMDEVIRKMLQTNFSSFEVSTKYKAQSMITAVNVESQLKTLTSDLFE